MNKKTKIFALSLFGGILLTTSAIATSVALVSCNNNDKPNKEGNLGDGDTTGGIFSYKPSEYAKILFTNDSFNNAKNNYNKWLASKNNNISKLFKEAIKDPKFPYKECSYNLNKLELNGDILTISCSTNLIYKTPIVLGENDTPSDLGIPADINIKDINSFEQKITSVTNIDLFNYKINDTSVVFNVINGKSYSNHLPDKREISIPDLNLFKLYLLYYEYGGPGIPKYSVNTGNLTNDEVDKLYTVLYKLIKIAPPTILNEWKSFTQSWDSISINLNSNASNNQSSITFEYIVNSDSFFGNALTDISYSFIYNNQTNSWDLQYKQTYPNAVPSLPDTNNNINGITDTQMHKFFKYILDNPTIMDINQIKK